jgi:hypothetical protein
MLITYVVVTALTIAINAWAAAMDFTTAKVAVGNARELNVGVSWLPVLGGLKAAGAMGLAIGLAGIHLLGIAAALGLVLFFVGAITVHVRARVLHSLPFPALFLAFAVASLALSVTVAR